MMNIVPSLVKDLNLLKDVDLKTYHYPLTDEAWTHALVKSPCSVCTVRISKTHVGYMIVEPQELNLRIHRLGVREKFRGNGVGKRLLERAEQLACDGKYAYLEVVVPDIHCIPGDLDNVALWLKFQGFRASGVLGDYFHMYGDDHDGYLFKRKVL